MRLAFLHLLVAAPLFAQGQQLQLPPLQPARSTELATPVVEVPLTKTGDFYFVQVLVNDRPFRFTIETGANFFGIGPHVARALGLKIDTAATPGGPGGDRSEFAAIRTLKFGGVTLEGLTTRVSPLFDGGSFVGDGIISLVAFRNLLATLDFANRKLRFEKGALPAANGRDVLPIVGQDRGGRIDIPVQIGERTIPMVLDSRSFVWFIVPDSLETQLPLAAPPRSIGEARGPSLGTFQLRGARASSDMRIGDIVVRQPPLTLRNRPGAVLGVPALDQMIVTIDQINRRVRVTRADGSPIVVPPLDWERGDGSTAAGPGRRGEVAASPPPQPGQRTMGFNLVGTPGSLLVRNVVAGSGAARAGLRDGDELVEFDGVAAASMSPSVFRGAAAKVSVKVIVMREGRRVTFEVEPYITP